MERINSYTGVGRSGPISNDMRCPAFLLGKKYLAWVGQHMQTATRSYCLKIQQIPAWNASIYSTAEVRRALPFSLKCHSSTTCLGQEGARFVGAPWWNITIFNYVQYLKRSGSASHFFCYYLEYYYKCTTKDDLFTLSRILSKQRLCLQTWR